MLIFNILDLFHNFWKQRYTFSFFLKNKQIIFIPLLYKCPPFKRYCPPGELLVAAIFALIIISQCVNVPIGCAICHMAIDKLVH